MELCDLVRRSGWTARFAPGFCVLSSGRNHTEPASGELTQNNSSVQLGHMKLSVPEGEEEGETQRKNMREKRGRRFSEACNRVER